MAIVPDIVQGRGGRRRDRPSFSVPSIVAGVAILVSFVTEGFDVLLAAVAIGFGLIGAILTLSPEIRGGIVSLASIGIGLLAIVVSVLQLIF